jgi:hypothetical protein
VTCQVEDSDLVSEWALDPAVVRERDSVPGLVPELELDLGSVPARERVPGSERVTGSERDSRTPLAGP